MSRRAERISELVRDEVARILREDLRDPRIGGLVSVTRVDVPEGMRMATVFVSVLGTEEERESTMKALRRARPFVRRELSKTLNLRFTPEVEFIGDISIQRGQELTDLMRENAAERGEKI
jgi:ribosome-binding factor A